MKKNLQSCCGKEETPQREKVRKWTNQSPGGGQLGSMYRSSDTSRLQGVPPQPQQPEAQIRKFDDANRCQSQAYNFSPQPRTSLSNVSIPSQVMKKVAASSNQQAACNPVPKKSRNRKISKPVIRPADKSDESTRTSLKSIARLVMEIVNAKVQTTQEFLAIAVIQLEEKARNCFMTKLQQDCIRRRVYDVLNALEPLNLIQRKGQLICSVGSEATMERQDMNIKITNCLNQCMQAALDYAILRVRYQAIRKLMKRNKKRKEAQARRSQQPIIQGNGNRQPVPDRLEGDLSKPSSSQNPPIQNAYNCDYTVLMDMLDMFELH